MAYEAMNNAEAAGNRLIVILNDNDMSIAPPVGGLAQQRSRGWSRSSKYLGAAQARAEARAGDAGAAPRLARARRRNLRAAW